MDWLVWGYRQAFCCKRKIQKLFFSDVPVVKMVHVDQLPWMWLGLVNSVGQTIVATHVVNEHLKPGVRVTPDYLERVTSFTGGIWHYIDSKTLEQKVFPSEGFIIDDSGHVHPFE